MKKCNKKLNDGCLKIFKFIKLLYEDKANYKDVTDIFRDEFESQSNNNIQVCLNKYINTLKIFGIKIVKQKGKYKLLSSLYSMNFTIDDMKAMSLLLNSVQQLTDGNFALKISEFMDALEFRMNSEAKNIFNNLTNSSEYDFSFYYKDTKNQISECEKLCEQSHMVKLVYLYNGEEISLSCYPKEVIYDSKNAYLRVFDTRKNESQDIPVNKILSAQMTPKRFGQAHIAPTVVYKLKNRLAKTYKLKENEYFRDYDADGNLVVVNSNEPKDKLFKRLMRYSYDCEIVSPKYLRRQMRELIDKTIENYR